MESRKGGLYFILFGFIIGFLGLYFASITESYNIFGYTVTYNPHYLVGTGFLSIGFGWFISGVILVLIEEREFNETGGLAVFFLGLLGLILWEVFREKTTYVQTSSEKNYDYGHYPSFNERKRENAYTHTRQDYPEHVRCPKCGEDVSMAGLKYRWCPHCRAKLEET